MSLQDLDKDDWGHRLGILAAWRHMLLLPLQDPHRTALYGAVLDGCAITIRALCYGFEISYDFKKFDDKVSSRRAELEKCSKGNKSVDSLTADTEEQRCVLEVLFLGNRAVAHPFQGKLLPHKVRGGIEMATAINVILRNVASQTNRLPELKAVFESQAALFQPLPIDRLQSLPGRPITP